MSQMIFLGDEPAPDTCVILGPGPAVSNEPQLWFRWKGDWVREEWCGKFPDGEARPPWYDALFLELWKTKGPEAAQDKTNYDLSEQRAIKGDG